MKINQRFVLAVVVISLFLCNVSFVGAFSTDVQEVDGKAAYLYAPEEFKAEAYSLGQIKLTWSESTDADGYAIYRKSSENGKYKLVIKLNNSRDTSYVDSGLKYAKIYYYNIKAFRRTTDTDIVYSKYSGEDWAKATFSCCNITNAAVMKKNGKLAGIKIQWDKIEGASKYEVALYDYFREGKQKKFITNKTEIIVSPKKLKNKSLYYIYVRAYKSVNGRKIYGENGWSEIQYTFPSKLPAPKNVKCKETKNGRIKLTWSVVKGADVYRVFVKYGKNGLWNDGRVAFENEYYYEEPFEIQPYTPTYFKVVSCKELGIESYIDSIFSSKEVGYQTQYEKSAKFSSKRMELAVRNALDIHSGDIPVYAVLNVENAKLNSQDIIDINMTDDEVDAVLCDIKAYDLVVYDMGYYLTANSDNTIYLQIRSKVADIIKREIKSGMRDYDKAKALHDYLVNNMEYDYNILEYGSDNPHTYDALILGKGVCHDYAEAYKLLCQYAGLECYYVSSNTHAWNVVKVNGKYYNVDCTWDDGSHPKYKYFLISDKKIEQIGGKSHVRDNGSRLRVPVCETDYPI